MTSIDSLKEIMPPPVHPSDLPGHAGWQSVERQLGFELPADYKTYIEAYGTGAVDGFLWVFNPFTHNDNVNLIKQAEVQLDAQRTLSKDFGLIAPYAFSPDANGLFPWGITDNGDVLFWLCNVSAAPWSIVVCDSRSSRWREFNCTTVQFLTEIIARDLIVDVFPEDFPSESPAFFQQGSREV